MGWSDKEIEPTKSKSPRKRARVKTGKCTRCSIHNLPTTLYGTNDLCPECVVHINAYVYGKQLSNCNYGEFCPLDPQPTTTDTKNTRCHVCPTPRKWKMCNWCRSTKLTQTELDVSCTKCSWEVSFTRDSGMLCPICFFEQNSAGSPSREFGPCATRPRR